MWGSRQSNDHESSGRDKATTCAWGGGGDGGGTSGGRDKGEVEGDWARRAAAEMERSCACRYASTIDGVLARECAGGPPPIGPCCWGIPTAAALIPRAAPAKRGHLRLGQRARLGRLLARPAADTDARAVRLHMSTREGGVCVCSSRFHHHRGVFAWTRAGELSRPCRGGRARQPRCLAVAGRPCRTTSELQPWCANQSPRCKP